MAHTRFILHADSVLDKDEIEGLSQRLSDFVLHVQEDDGIRLEFTIDILEPKRTVKIRHDDDCSDPRDNDNADVMFCRHDRYQLGDKGADDPYEEVAGAEVDGRWMPNEEIDHVIDMLEEMRDEDDLRGAVIIRAGAPEGTPAYSIDDVIEELVRAYDSDTRMQLCDDIALCRPLYLYDHSGITISAGPFSCPWDSGQVGWQYVTKKALQEEWDGDEAMALKYMDATLEEYDNYIRGNCWYFIVEDEEGDVVDSCCGFIGDDLEETGMLEYIDEDLREQAKEAWENRQ